jgi:hypothetical protein
MDTEQTCQPFTQAHLRCLILEADRDAEASRADKYRKILDIVAGELEESPDDTESQAAPTLHAAGDAWVRRIVAYCRPCSVLTWMFLSRHRIQLD